MTDLTSTLSIGIVDDSELAYLLGERFNRAEQRDNEVTYFAAGADWAVKLKYDDDKVTAAESGPSFREEDQQYLRNRKFAGSLALAYLGRYTSFPHS